MLFKILKELKDDAYLKAWAKQNNYDTYPSSTGQKDVKTGKHCCVNLMTGKKTTW